MDFSIKNEQKREINGLLILEFGSLYFMFCHIAYNFLNVQLLVNMLNL